MTGGDRDRDDRPELDVDTAFAALVAQFSAPATKGHPWPDSEDVPDEPPEVRTSPDAEAPPDVPAVLPLAFPPAGDEPATPRELDEHYEPPEPPPFPRGDVVSRFAWAGVIGGPLFLLIAAMLSADLPPPLLLAALGAFIGGFVTLVARMPGESPDDGDDGAVV